MKLLHIDSSITGENSASRAVSGAIVAALRAADPSLEVVHRDLVAEPLPHLTLDVLGNPEGTPELAEFLAADVLVIGAAMYNFTIPSQLKAWFDRVLIAGKTFRYTAEGPVGLAGGKKVFIALARGGTMETANRQRQSSTPRRTCVPFSASSASRIPSSSWRRGLRSTPIRGQRPWRQPWSRRVRSPSPPEPGKTS
ncbi:FMN-dependent NADH-azoreductase [Novosphingobium panipatense]